MSVLPFRRNIAQVIASFAICLGTLGAVVVWAQTWESAENEPQDRSSATEAESKRARAQSRSKLLQDTDTTSDQGSRNTQGKHPQVKIFELQHADVVECVKQLKVLFSGLSVTADARTKSIILTYTDEEQWKAVDAVVNKLDSAQTRPPMTTSTPKDAFSHMASTPKDAFSQSGPDAHHREKGGDSKTLVVYRLHHIEASDFLKRIERQFAGRASLAVENQNLLVQADSGTHAQIQAVIQFADRPADSTGTSGAAAPDSFTWPLGVTSPGVLNDPVGRRLLDRLADHEREAGELAQRIRVQTNGAAKPQPQVAEARRQLDESLAAALAVKLQLEELQIQALEKRVARLSTQVSQRKGASNEIVARRAAELINAPQSSGTGGTPTGGLLGGQNALLRERIRLLFAEFAAGNAEAGAVLAAIKDLAAIEPLQHVALLEELLILAEKLFQAEELKKADLLAIRAAYEQARGPEPVAR